MIPNPHGRRVAIYNSIIICVNIYSFEINENKVINKILTKHTTHCTIYFFLAGAAPEFLNQVIDTVIKIPYPYFHMKNKHFGNY